MHRRICIHDHTGSGKSASRRYSMLFPFLLSVGKPRIRTTWLNSRLLKVCLTSHGHSVRPERYGCEVVG